MALDNKQVNERIDTAAAGAKGGIDTAREGVADMQALRREIDQERGALNAEANTLRSQHGNAFTESGAYALRAASETTFAAEARSNAKTWADQGNQEQAQAWTDKAKGHEAAAAEATAKSSAVLKESGADQAIGRLGEISQRLGELDTLGEKASVAEKTAAKELYEGERVEAADPDAYGSYQSAKSAFTQADRDVKGLEQQVAKAEKDLQGAEKNGDPHIASKQEFAKELRETLADAKEARHEAKAQLAEAKIEYERVAEDNPSAVDPDPNAKPAEPAPPAQPAEPAPPAADQPPAGGVTLPPPIGATPDVEQAPGAQHTGGAATWDSSAAGSTTWDSAGDATASGNGASAAGSDQQPAGSTGGSTGGSSGFDPTGNDTGAAS